MKIKQHIMVMLMPLILLTVTLTTSIFPQGFSWDVSFNHYDANMDHYAGAACVQMALDNCEYPLPQPLNSQDEIFSAILGENSESNWWFSDPHGMKMALNGAGNLNACGNWVDVSGTDREQVLGEIFYWMKVQEEYLTPVNIGNGQPYEYWVVITGYTTDIDPTAANSQVNLLWIRFYDPNAGGESFGEVDGNAWTTQINYWKYPYNNPNNNSAWNGKFIAILEPPKVNITVKVPIERTKKEIIPIEIIRKTCYSWLKKKILEARKRCHGPYKMLKSPIIKKTKLINAKNSKYYLILLNDKHTVVIWNPYNNKAEEFRYFINERIYCLDSGIIYKKIKKILSQYNVKNVKMSKWDIRYERELAEVGLGRLSPVSVATLSVEAPYLKKFRKKNRKKYELVFYCNYAGHLIKSKGLDKLPVAPGKVKKLKEKHK